MNKQETAKIFTVLQANYPDSFKSMSNEALHGVVNLWNSVLSDYTYAEVKAAVIAHIASDTNRFMPPVGVINTMLIKLKSPPEMTELEAWALVSKATKNAAYNAKEEFDKLPDEIKEVVRVPDTLRNWALLDESEVETVIQSNFMRSFRAKQKVNKEQAALPQNVKSFLGELTTNMTLTKVLENK